jgi:ribonuclease HIII
MADMTSGRIGTDEAGKGDYFGPLVVAAVWVDKSAEATLVAQGVKDSKRTTDAVSKRLARNIAALCPHQVVKIFPEKYNQLIAKIGNLNRLLGWAHARAIESLLETMEKSATPGPERLVVIADQFGDESYLRDALMKRGKTVELIQQVRAEEHIAVAAASLLARANFLDGLARLAETWQVNLPKGASNVLSAGREIRDKGGMELLNKVAKVHFRTTRQILTGKDSA